MKQSFGWDKMKMCVVIESGPLESVQLPLHHHIPFPPKGLKVLCQAVHTHTQEHKPKVQRRNVSSL